MSNSTRLLLVAPLALLAACVDNRASIELKRICAPPEDAVTCTFKATCDLTAFGPYTFDTGPGGPSHQVFIEVENQTPDNANKDGHVNTNDAFVQEIAISYTGPLALSDSTQLLQQLVPAAGSTVLRVFTLPPATVAEIPAVIAGTVEVVAEVKAKGIYQDGTTFETGAFEIPIQLCTNCLGTLGCPNLTDLLYTCPPGVAPGGQLYQTPFSAKCQAP